MITYYRYVYSNEAYVKIFCLFIISLFDFL